MSKKKQVESYLPAARERAVNITMYDLQGGPIHPEVVQAFVAEAENIAQEHPNLALDIRVV